MRDRSAERETEKEMLFCCGQEQVCLRGATASQKDVSLRDLQRVSDLVGWEDWETG